MRPALVLCVVAGCGGASVPSPPTANDPGYPPPPYGYTPSEVLPDLLFAGKTIPVGTAVGTAAAQMISLGSLRTAGARYFVIETVGEWCSDCIGDQPSMMQLEADYAPKGVVGMEIILEAGIGAAPTMDNLDRWSNAYDVTGTLLLDKDKAVEHAAGIIAFPSYYVVDVSTMQIRARSQEPLVAQPLGPILDNLLAQ